MEAVTKNAEAKVPMPGDETAEKLPKQPQMPPSYPASTPGSPGFAVSPARGGGYFRIYKKGQGYWTRMGTVAGASLIGILTSVFLWDQSSLLHLHARGAYVLVGAFILIYALLSFHYINKPASVDFLIATDSEMKKVNWTTKQELIGSTKVVILFVIIIAVLLLVYDLFFQTLFWYLNVLKTPPFWK